MSHGVQIFILHLLNQSAMHMRSPFAHRRAIPDTHRPHFPLWVWKHVFICLPVLGLEGDTVKQMNYETQFIIVALNCGKWKATEALLPPATKPTCSLWRQLPCPRDLLCCHFGDSSAGRVRAASALFLERDMQSRRRWAWQGPLSSLPKEPTPESALKQP